MPLLNAFIDSIVSVGFSAERGCRVERSSPDPCSPSVSSLKPDLLSIITAEHALYLQSPDRHVVDPFYPAICYTSNSSTSASTTASLSKPTIPIAYHNLPLFCSPDTVGISSQPQNSRIHHIVFTQEDGKRSFAVVLTFPERFLLKSDKPDDDGRYQIEPLTDDQTRASKKPKSKIPSSYRQETSVSRMRERSSSSTSARTTITFLIASEPVYLPHCLVLVSSHPYWTAMQETISIIHDNIIHSNIEPSSDAYRQLVQKYAFLACNTPTPPIPCDQCVFSFTVANQHHVLTLDAPLFSDRAVLDLDLSSLLLTLNVPKLVDVLAAVLTQQPIIFFSSDYSKLVTTLECLLYLMYPFKWLQIYIPIVPDGLSDYYLEGPPGSYIMGVHSRQQLTVEALDYCLTCSLDNEENLRVPSSIPFHPIPAERLQGFIGPIAGLVDEIKTTRSMKNINTAVRWRLDQQRVAERQHRTEMNHLISEIFLDLMVELCADVLEPIYWRMENQTARLTSFSKEKYVRSKAKGAEQDFYQAFLESTAFQLFLEEQKASETITEFQKICQLRSQAEQSRALRLATNSDDNDDDIQQPIPTFDIATAHVVMPLPDWSLSIGTHYLDSCVELFTIELEQARNERSHLNASVYAYLRGCALLARGSLLDGLRDLYLIDNPKLFPKGYIETTVVPRLAETHLLERFHHESFYVRSSAWKKLDETTSSSEHRDDSLDTRAELRSNGMKDSLSSEQFSEHVRQMSIVADSEIAAIVFNALLHLAGTSKKSTDTYRQRRSWSIGSNFSKEAPGVQANQQREMEAKSRSLPADIPTKLFERFLDVWQQISTFKTQMAACLPQERQRQEAVLFVSSSDIVSRKDECSKLLLTQRGLYSFKAASSTAVLLIELLKIAHIESCQQRSLFLSSKSMVRIYTFSPTSSQHHPDPSVTLVLKDNHEQTFWHKIIVELWSAVIIAHKECDANVLHRISRHLAVIDALTCIESDEQESSAKTVARLKQNVNQTYLQTALEKLTVFTRLYKSGTYKNVNDETRAALHIRLSPSMNETERCDVRGLVFTESPDSRCSLLWCAYGQKLKMFNATTWLCHPSDVSFPSPITCMCSDACDKLWVGCADGQIFVVDTIQLIGGTQLASIQNTGGCQAMAFDALHNRMLIAYRSGGVSIWNTHSRQCSGNINLLETYNQTYLMPRKMHQTDGSITLPASSDDGEAVMPTSLGAMKAIQVYENLLFVGYEHDYLLVFRTAHSDAFVCEAVVSVKYNENTPVPITSFLVYNDQLWVSAGAVIYVFSINYGAEKNSYPLVMKKYLEDDHLLAMIGCDECVWAGSARGNVYTFQMDNYELIKTFSGHRDGVSCLCSMLDTFVVSASQQQDTSIIIWKNESRADEALVQPL